MIFEEISFFLGRDGFGISMGLTENKSGTSQNFHREAELEAKSTTTKIHGEVWDVTRSLAIFPFQKHYAFTIPFPLLVDLDVVTFSSPCVLGDIILMP